METQTKSSDIEIDTNGTIIDIKRNYFKFTYNVKEEERMDKIYFFNTGKKRQDTKTFQYTAQKVCLHCNQGIVPEKLQYLY